MKFTFDLHFKKKLKGNEKEIIADRIIEIIKITNPDDPHIFNEIDTTRRVRNIWKEGFFINYIED